MSYTENILDMQCDKIDFQKNRPSNIVTKMQARKLSAEPNWAHRRNDDEDSISSSQENFLTKGAFLLTPAFELSMERASSIFEKMTFKGCFSLTKTATGILFKFSHPDDYQAVYKKGFHKVTGARFYRKISIPCRPRKTFTLFVLDIPEDLPVEDIRHALYKFDSVVEVIKLTCPHRLLTQHGDTVANETSAKSEYSDKVEPTEHKELSTSVVRVTLASLDEYNILLQNGLNFYDATFFPTEANISLKGAKLDLKRSIIYGSIPGRVRDLLPVFDASGFCKLPPPTSKLIKTHHRS